MYPVKRFSRPVRGTWKNRGPVFSAFLFFTNPILYSFSRYPPFFLPPSSSPPSVSPRFLPLVDGKGENLAGEWKGEESVYVYVCVCGVEGASDDRWIFRKGFTKLRVSLPSAPFSLVHEWTEVHSYSSIHHSIPFLPHSSQRYWR